ncbi:hypothetical protein MA16_Dca004735 [Dendrobium catenatum]|uniref:Transmembrane protein n=1 Tax=Dendrobium catenatum TaxID=906689 RepID=A0A2I0VNZ6_9ASPA|nr:hypothetical protein MA16_Dca004735 [Dendrobium catenatum]
MDNGCGGCRWQWPSMMAEDGESPVKVEARGGLVSDRRWWWPMVGNGDGKWWLSGVTFGVMVASSGGWSTMKRG